MRLRLGCLDSEIDERPAAHIYVAEKPAWSEIHDDDLHAEAVAARDALAGKVATQRNPPATVVGAYSPSTGQDGNEMKSADDLRGLEFDWLAVDAEGAVALFSTAGGGYAPAPLVENTDDYNAAIDAILALPVRTRARCERELRPDLTNTWKLVAERGLFAFDSDPLGGPYRVIATPEERIRVSDLPATVAEVARRIVYVDLRFDDVPELTEAQLGG